MNYSDYLTKDNHAIFLFHGVVTKHRYKVRNYIRKHIDFERFSEVIDSLHNKGNCISMDDFLDRSIKKKVLPKYSYSITFDDGFENNLINASPYLIEKKLPHMIYLTTSFIEDQSLSWIDKIEYAIDITKTKKLELDCLTSTFDISNYENKIETLNFIRSKVKNSKKFCEKKLVNEVFFKLKISNIKADKELDKKISWDQIKRFAKHPLISFGGHSHNHKILSFLPLDELNYEISICLGLLNQKADIDTVHFSYPEGLKHCFSEEVKKTLKKYGIRCCPTAINGVNSLSTDLFQLKRINVV